MECYVITFVLYSMIVSSCIIVHLFVLLILQTVLSFRGMTSQESCRLRFVSCLVHAQNPAIFTFLLIVMKSSATVVLIVVTMMMYPIRTPVHSVVRAYVGKSYVLTFSFVIAFSARRL